MLIGRLGLDTARIPHADRAGLLWLSKGRLNARDGSLSFERKAEQDEDSPLAPGHYSIPFQSISMILLGPGSTVSHDALRLLARHGTGLAAIGENGVRLYTAPPLGRDSSKLARQQALEWAIPDRRLQVAKRMYAWRLGRILPHRDISVLRGIEGARMKKSYQLIAEQIGITWNGRRYNRSSPSTGDLPNQALNHAATAVEAAAAIAVSATATIPQLGFIHEDPGQSFVLDIADLHRDSVTIPAAFRAAKSLSVSPHHTVDRITRKEVGQVLEKEKVIHKMIEQIKELFGTHDSEKSCQ